MEFQRRIGHGRLSEIFGAATVPQDRFLRTVGFGRAARSAWERLPEDARAKIDAYVAGVNAFIDGRIAARRCRRSSRCCASSRSRGPARTCWCGSKMMAWDLSANYSFELLRHDLSARVGADRMHELLPPYPPDGLSILDRVPARPPVQRSVGSPTWPRPTRLRAGTSAWAGTSAGTYAIGGGRVPPDWSVSFASALAGGHPFVRELLRAARRPRASARTTGSSTAR